MPKPKEPTDRSFGFTFVVVFALIAAWQIWADRPVAAQIFLGLSGATLAITLIRPATLGPLNRAWMKFGAMLHVIVSPIVLGGMFFLVITPVAWILKLIGRDAMHRRYDREAQTYWIQRTPPGPPPGSLPNQF